MRLVIVDDHPLLLEGLAYILKSEGHQIVATCGEPLRLLSLLKEHRVDAVTLDVGMPGLNGIDLARQVHASFPAIRIVFVTQQTDAVYIRSAFQVGATAFISKQAAGTELVHALRYVGGGRQYVTPGLLDSPLGMQMALRDLQRQGNHDLTPRQREVLQQIAEGKSVKEIASALNISTKTVEFHKQALVNALGVRTTAELTRYAIAHGLTFI